MLAEGKRTTGVYSECAKLKITARVEFFPNDAKTSPAKKARPARRVYDDCLMDFYIFVWYIGMEGRLRLTFEAPGHVRTPLRVRKVVLRIGTGDPHDMEFVQEERFERHGRGSMRIDVPLCAIEKILTKPSPYWGDVKKRYVPLNFIMTAECHATELKSIDTFIKTIYCHVRRDWKTWLSCLTQTTPKNRHQECADRAESASSLS